MVVRTILHCYPYYTQRAIYRFMHIAIAWRSGGRATASLCDSRLICMASKWAEHHLLILHASVMRKRYIYFHSEAASNLI